MNFVLSIFRQRDQGASSAFLLPGEEAKVKVLAEPIMLEGDLVRGFHLGRKLRRDDRNDINCSSVKDEGGSSKGGGFMNLEDVEVPLPLIQF